METKFFKFVWKYSKRDQIIISALTVASFPLVYMSLEVPKVIINDAIEGADFPREYFGIEFDQIPYLLLLCGIYLALVIAINGLKWLMNVQIGMTGERMLRRLRFMLFERVMRFRISRFRSTRPGEVIQSILGEIEPLGGFFGEVISTPFFQGGLLCVYVTFIFVQDWILGLAAISLYPLQAWLIPRLQRKIVRLNKERARNTRALADKIGEAVNVVSDIHTNDTARWHLAQTAGGLYSNTKIRLELFKRKFTIKFINNFMNHITPFFFYSAGGYLVIKGDLDFGSLVAVLAAYKDVAAPWKAVLNYLQRWTDFNSRYLFVIEAFSGEDVLSEDRVYAKVETLRPLAPPLEFTNVEGGPGTGGLTVPNLVLQPGETIAVCGGGQGAREALLKLAAGLTLPAAGRVALGNRSLADATMPEIGGSLAYVGAEPGIVSRSMRENFLYGLFQGAPDLVNQSDARLADMLREARLTGNSTANPEGDWVDYELAGFSDGEALDAKLLDLIDRVGLTNEIYSSALNAQIDPSEIDVWDARIAEARRHLEAMGTDLSDIVEEWDPDRFNTNASILENVLYARPVEVRSDLSDYVDLPSVTSVLNSIGATPHLVAIGHDIAREFAELVDAVEADSAVLDGFAGYGRADILAASDLIAAVGNAPKLDALKPDQRRLLLKLAVGFIPARDRLDVLDDDRIAALLACRQKARELLPKRDDFVVSGEARFNPARNILGNLLSARRRFDRRNAWKRLDAMLEEAVTMAGFRDDMIRLGLARHVTAEGTLSSSTRRRIALVRALIKRPNLVILDGIAGSESAEDVALRKTLREELPDATILYAATDEAAIDIADRVARIASSGQVHCENPANDAKN